MSADSAGRQVGARRWRARPRAARAARAPDRRARSASAAASDREDGEVVASTSGAGAARSGHSRAGRSIVGYPPRRNKPPRRSLADRAPHRPDARASRSRDHAPRRRARAWSAAAWSPSRCTTGACAGRFLPALEAALEGRTHRRRSIVGASTCSSALPHRASRHAARPPRHDRQPARVPRGRRPAGRTTTSTSRSTAAARCATTTRAASARCSGSRATRRGHPLLAPLGAEPFDAEASTPTASIAGTRGRRVAIKLALMDNHARRRRGQHLRERGAVPRGHPADPRRRAAVARYAWRHSWTRCARRWPTRSPGRQHAARLRRQPRRARRLPARVLRLRPRRRALPRLRHRRSAPSARASARRSTARAARR